MCPRITFGYFTGLSCHLKPTYPVKAGVQALSGYLGLQSLPGCFVSKVPEALESVAAPGPPSTHRSKLPENKTQASPYHRSVITALHHSSIVASSASIAPHNAHGNLWLMNNSSGPLASSAGLAAIAAPGQGFASRAHVEVVIRLTSVAKLQDSFQMIPTSIFNVTYTVVNFFVLGWQLAGPWLLNWNRLLCSSTLAGSGDSIFLLSVLIRV